MATPAPESPPDPDGGERTAENGQPERAPEGEAAGGFPEPSGDDPGDRSGDDAPHHALNNPVTEPDPTEWPDPYEKREDPLDPDERPTPGSTSTSQPHPSEDPEIEEWEGPKRDKLDD